MRLVIFFLFLSCCAAAQKTGLVQGYTFTLDKSGISSDTVLAKRLWYNPAGLLVKEENIMQDSRGRHRIIKIYDTTGKLVRKEGIFKDSTFISNTDFHRDSKGEILRQVFSGTDDSATLIHNNVYGGNGKLARSVMVAKGGAGSGEQVAGETSYRYDSKGRLVSFTQQLAGTVVSECIITYDSQGNRSTETTKSRQGTERFVFAYDRLNRKSSQKFFTGTVWQSTTTYRWSGQNPAEERSLLADGTALVVLYR